MQESTATIKLTKSEIEWNIIALVWMEKSSEEFRRPHDATMFRKLKKDKPDLPYWPVPRIKDIYPDW